MSADPKFTTLSLTRPGAKRLHIPQVENEDRVLVREFTAEETRRGGPATLIAVADGVSRCADGGAVAEWILHERLAKDIPFESANTPILDQFRKYLLEIHKQFMGEFQSNLDIFESGCTLCAVLAYGNKAAAYWAGDSPIYHFQPGKTSDRMRVRQLTIPDKDPFTGALTDCFSGLTPFAVKQAGLNIAQGDIVVAASDGLAFDGDDLVTTIHKLGYNEEWMTEICNLSYDQPYSDDISLAGFRVDAPE
ncbi:MAG: serine/threonine protein phosphatase PrpC [Verrucomicrobiales bacterium]|jgi:serine/threonine protein phosphatase PrpC